MADDGHGSLEDQRLAAHPTQLGGGPYVVAGLAKRFAREVGDLVGADHHRLGKARGHGVGFF
ncbi:hypothetical protein D9M68_495420 [compost metagenome]